jgi:hypothetical protein
MVAPVTSFRELRSTEAANAFAIERRPVSILQGESRRAKIAMFQTVPLVRLTKL